MNKWVKLRQTTREKTNKNVQPSISVQRIKESRPFFGLTKVIYAEFPIFPSSIKWTSLNLN